MIEARLIDQPSVREQLLAAVAAAPAGVKLSIPQLRDALVSQADVLAGLEWLVRTGELDRATLRPPMEAAGAEPPAGDASTQPAGGSVTGARSSVRPSTPTGAQLTAMLDAYVERHGLARNRVGMHLFGSQGALVRLRRTPAPRPPTVAKVRAFVAGDPPPGLELGPRGTLAVGISGAQLAAELDALIARHGLSETAVGLRLFNNRSGVKALRKSGHPRLRTVTKVRALLADPRLAELRSRAPRGDRRYSENRPSDPTLRPADPALEDGERQRVRAARRSAGVLRSAAEEAARRLNGEKVGGAETPMVRSAKQQILDRRAAEARQTEPVEQARLALQRSGRAVYAASVHGGPKGRFHVSGQRDGNGRLKELTPAEVIGLAERLTGISFRRGSADAPPHTNPAASSASQGER